MSYVYKRTEHNPPLWTVGFYAPNGTWEAESDHSTDKEAAERCHFLNGGSSNKDTEILEWLESNSRIGWDMHYDHVEIKFALEGDGFDTIREAVQRAMRQQEGL